MKKSMMLLSLISLAFIGCDVETAKDNRKTEGKDQATTDQDRQILQQVQKALQSHQGLNTSVHIEVVHGKVTLGGTVPSLELKETLEKEVKAITNVKDVRNELKVEANTPH